MTLNPKSRTSSETMKWKAMLVFIVLLFCQNLLSQSITWQRTYKQYDYNLGKSACQTSDGNFVIVGQATGNKVFAMKINPLGDTLWSIIQNSMSNSLALSVIPTNNGGVLLTGGWTSAFVTKLSSSGQVEWTKTYVTGRINCNEIKKTNDGGYVFCGGFVYDLEKAYICKIDSSGNLIWERIYSSLFYKEFESIELAHDGGYIITGAGQGSEVTPGKILIFKVSETGDSVWENRFTISTSPAGLRIRKLNQGYLVGGLSSDSAGRTQIFTCKINLIGDTSKVVKYPTNGRNEMLGDMKVLNENRYVLCYLRDSVTINYSAVGMIVDSSGNILIKKNFANSTYFLWGNLNTVTTIANGDLLFTGTAKITQPYGGEWVYAVRTDSLLNTPVIGINYGNEILPKDFGLLQNYPNPFNPNTTITFSLAKSGVVKIKIFDITGKEIEVKTSKYYNAGNHKFDFTANNLSSGIYFYQLIVDDKIKDTKKMCLLK